MDGFLSKLIGLVLIFFMLVIAPVINVLGVEDSQDKTEILNDTCEFMDMVTDKRSITDDDLNEFYLKIASHGIVADVRVERLVRVAATDSTSSVQVHSSYVVADDSSYLNVGDMVRVTIEETSTTLYRRMLRVFLRFDQDGYELTMAKVVK
jgi:hypothetical protein